MSNPFYYSIIKIVLGNEHIMKIQIRKYSVNYILLLVFFLHSISTPISYAQFRVDKEWEVLIGGPRRDEAWSVMETSDQGFIITGVTWSFSDSDSDIILVKTDSKGNTEWIKSYGGSLDDHGNHVIQTSDNGYLICGAVTNPGTGDDAFILKTNSTGVPQWNLTYSTPGFDEAAQSINCNDYYLVIGTTRSLTQDNSDVLLLNVTLSGKISSIKQFGGKRKEFVSSISPLRGGGYVISGDILTADDGVNGLLIVLNSEGELELMKDFGGKKNEVFTACYETGSGDFVAFGFESVVYNSIIMKMSSEGELLWNKTYGGEYSTWSYDGTVTDSGCYILVGYSGNKESNGFHLFQTDKDGELLWDFFSGAGTATSVDLVSDGGIIIAGTTLSGGMGAKDIRLVKIDAGFAISKTEYTWLIVFGVFGFILSYLIYTMHSFAKSTRIQVQ